MSEIVNNPSGRGKEESIFATENLEEDTGFLMLQVSSLWKEYHGNTLKKRQTVSSMQYAVLSSIYRFNTQGIQQVTQSMLAKYLKTESVSLSYLFRKLEAKGYIHRVSDAKEKVVSLTPKGKELTSQTISFIAEADYKFFESLSENSAYFNKQLQKLLETNK